MEYFADEVILIVKIRSFNIIVPNLKHYAITCIKLYAILFLGSREEHCNKRYYAGAVCFSSC